MTPNLINILLQVCRFFLLFMVASTTLGVAWGSPYFTQSEFMAYGGGIWAMGFLFWSSSPARLTEGNFYMIVVMVILYLYSTLIMWTGVTGSAGRISLLVGLLAFSFTIWVKSNALLAK